MKKWLFCLGLIASITAIVYQRSARKEYLKAETMLNHLRYEPFAKNLKRTPPPWMQEQIEEDFREFTALGISKAAVDATFALCEKAYPASSMMVRYRILDQELYRFFPEPERITLKDNSTEKAIKTLLQSTHLPDMDFILSYFDGLPSTDFFHTPSKSLQAPVFISAKLRNTPYTPLIPDWRSIGHWWMSDIKEIRSKRIPWEEKKNFALWRGSLTKPIRLKLCQLSALHPTSLDAKFSDPLLQGHPEAEQFLGERASWEEFLQCKYLPYIDGVMCAAPALQWRLLSNSVTFKPDSEEIQWFYKALQPHVHYIPVKEDLEDLIEKIEWAQSNDALCKEIAQRACTFAENNLLYGDVLFYFSLVLKRYASLQQMTRSEIQKEIQENPRWVKIQYRTDLKKVAKQHQMDGYQPECSPF